MRKSVGRQFGYLVHIHPGDLVGDHLVEEVFLRPYIVQGVPKKLSHRFKGDFRPLNCRKSIKVRKQTLPKIKFYLLGGVFSPVYEMYTLLYIMYTKLVSGIC